MYEQKQVATPPQATQLNEALGTGAGYLAVFNNVDLQRDAIRRGAFAGSIAYLEEKRKARGGRYLMPLLFQHSPDQPAGGFTLLREDNYGLYCEFELDMGIELGRRVFSALKKSYIGGFSIGYRVINSSMGQNGVRNLLELTLIEASAVTFPANELATPIAGSMKHLESIDVLARDLIQDMHFAVSRYGGAQKGRNEVANEKIGRLYINREYGTKTAAEALHVPEEALKAWLQQEERGDGLVKTPRGGSWVYPGWELCQIVQAHGLDADLIDTRPVGAKAGTPESAWAEDGQYRIEKGRADESWTVLEASMRRELRASDPDLYELTPGGKAFQAEIERRQKAHEEKQRLQREALAADRKAIADARIEPLETYTLEALAAKSGLDLVWLTRFIQTCIAGGEVKSAVDGTLILRGCDYGRLAKKHHQEFEMQFVRAANKRAEQQAQKTRQAA